MNHTFDLGICFPPGAGGNFLASMILIQRNISSWGRRGVENNEWYVNPHYCHRHSAITNKQFMWANHNAQCAKWLQDNNCRTKKVYIIENSKVCMTIHLLKRLWNVNTTEAVARVLLHYAWEQPFKRVDARDIAKMRNHSRAANQRLQQLKGDDNGEWHYALCHMYYVYILNQPYSDNWQRLWDDFVIHLLEKVYNESEVSVYNFSPTDCETTANELLTQKVADDVEILNFDQCFVDKSVTILDVSWKVIDRWMLWNNKLVTDLIDSMHDVDKKQQQIELCKQRYPVWNLYK